MNPEVTSLIPYNDQGPTTEVLSIMKRVVSLTSENKYKAHSNSALPICIFNHDANWASFVARILGSKSTQKSTWLL